MRERETDKKNRTDKHADKESKVILLEPLSPKCGHRLLKKKEKGYILVKMINEGANPQK